MGCESSACSILEYLIVGVLVYAIRVFYSYAQKVCVLVEFVVRCSFDF